MNWKTLIREPSTYRGVIWLATAAGLVITPEQQTAIVSAGAALAGLIGVFCTDSPKE